MTTETEAPELLDVKQPKPRGACTGCKFEYQLGTARTGEFKGTLVIRKHNSRTGPGLCDGAQKPPAGAEEPEPTEEETAQFVSTLASSRTEFMMPGHVHQFAWADDGNGHSGSVCDCGELEPDGPHPDYAGPDASAPQEGKGPWIDALHYGECSGCGERIEPGAIIRADGEGGWEISGCPENVKPARGVRETVAAVAEAVGLTQATRKAVADIQAARAPEGADVAAMAEAVYRAADPQAMPAVIAPGEPIPATPQAQGHGVLIMPPGPAADWSPMTRDGELIGYTTPAPVLAGPPAIIDPVGPAQLVSPPVSTPLPVPDQFMAPGPRTEPDIPEGSVSMQPDPDRDRWGRYLLLGQPHTRATTFAKSASNTFTLNEWQQRMVVKGVAMRPDIAALAHGLDVRQDKQTLNSLAEQAKEFAGSKVAANIGTAYHSFTERIDAGLMTLAEVPMAYQPRVAQYLDVMQRSGLSTRREWIERTTAVRADQVSADIGVGGMLDRILQLPNGELVIGDLKTGRDLSYGWVEIAVQLALYAHGVNTHGLFDWNTKTWGQPLPVRTDFAIVMHLPAEGDGCTLYRVDLAKGWEYAQVCGRVMTMQKDKAIAYELTVPDAPPPPVIEPTAVHPEPGLTQYRDEMMMARKLFREVRTQEEAAGLYGYAAQSGKFSPDELNALVQIGMAALAEPPY